MRAIFIDGGVSMLSLVSMAIIIRIVGWLEG